MIMGMMIILIILTIMMMMTTLVLEVILNGSEESDYSDLEEGWHFN